MIEPDDFLKESEVGYRYLTYRPSMASKPLSKGAERDMTGLRAAMKELSKMSKLEKINADQKNDIESVPIWTLHMVNDALRLGKLKGYEKHSWAEGYTNCTMAGALLRHLTAFLAGEDINIEKNKDTGELIESPHVTAILFAAVELASNYYLDRKHLDDRWQKEKFGNIDLTKFIKSRSKINESK
jgi:hypothetical protein